MTVGARLHLRMLSALRCLWLLVFLAALAPWGALAQGPQPITEVRVEGTQRIDPETVRSYVLIKPGDIADENKRRAAERSLQYMGLNGGEKMTDIAINRVFIGSCTNSRIEDLRDAARVAQGKTVSANVYAMIVPGSGLVKEQAESEGLDKIFKAAGFEWREPGCSMCLAMNPDKLKPGERCASTSNRNFEGRQGRGGRTHLVSPAMAVAAQDAGQVEAKAVHTGLSHLGFQHLQNQVANNRVIGVDRVAATRVVLVVIARAREHVVHTVL